MTIKRLLEKSNKYSSITIIENSDCTFTATCFTRTIKGNIKSSLKYKTLTDVIDYETEFEVDSSATRVIVKEGGNTTLDIMIGKFLFQQPRSVSTYVRLNGDADVYLVDGFISMTFNQGADSYRNNIIVKGDPKNWDQLVFSYPADSSFQLSKINDKWLSNGVPLDSAKTEKYLSQLARLTNSNFVNDFNSESVSPIYKLTYFSKLFIFNFLPFKYTFTSGLHAAKS